MSGVEIKVENKTYGYSFLLDRGISLRDSAIYVSYGDEEIIRFTAYNRWAKKALTLITKLIEDNHPNKESLLRAVEVEFKL
jgi:hypothetical protein